ncbi:MAG: indole-3-glycerol phosphate synthase TrpC [Clostridiales Family XIII bacterium]|jgi:indole-3-glycerol phosphate synthase|nr:indole-3-glycerol phosphate synthase TrpC [Clostridiales Family XIII bacterium]
MRNQGGGTILDKIADRTRVRVAAAKAAAPSAVLRARAEGLGIAQGGARFLTALRRPGISFICEVKKASPSKGVIAEDFPYLEIARAYEAAGADAISVLTEPEFFLGSARYLEEISGVAAVPLLRKDFVIDDYQLYESRLIGASAVLLIAALLGEKVSEYLALARALGLAALVEIHDAEEAALALAAGAEIVGVNNRDLRTFEVDTGLSARLREHIPAQVLFVAESGVKSAGDVRDLAAAGADAVLVGESVMRAADKTAFLNELRGGVRAIAGSGRPLR